MGFAEDKLNDVCGVGGGLYVSRFKNSVEKQFCVSQNKNGKISILRSALTIPFVLVC